MTAAPFKPKTSKRGLASVIIPCWNGLRYTRACLNSVRARTRSPYEIIIVDNGSTDGTGAFVRSLSDPRISLIQNKRNRGFSAAINQGMEKAVGEYFVWLNSDAVVTSGWLERLISHVERTPRAAAVGPLTNWGGISFQFLKNAPRGVRKIESFAQALSLANQGRAFDVPRITGFCFLVKSAAARRVGLLDERFGLGLYEDYDYCLRLRQAGYEILVAEDAFVHHGGHKTFAANHVNSNGLGRRNHAAFIDKWCRKALEFVEGLGADATGPGAPPRLVRKPSHKRR